MRLLTIHLQRFRLHADTLVAFAPDGVSGLIGSNESGKTSILEGLAWSLYGAPALRGSAKSIRWNRSPAKRQAAVTLRFSIRDTVFRVERTESSAKLFDETAGTCIAEGVAPVNQFMPGLIGMSLSEWSASFLCQQKDVSRLAAMGATERIGFIRKVLGMEKIDAGLKKLRDRRKELGQQLEGLTAGLGEREPLALAVEQSILATERAETARAAAQGGCEHAEMLVGDALDALGFSRSARDKHAKAVQVRDQAVADQLRTGIEARRLQLEVEACEKAAGRVLAATGDLAELPGLRAERDQLVRAGAQASETETLRTRLAALNLTINGPTSGIRTAIADVRRQIRLHDPAVLAAANTAAGEADQELQGLRDKRLAALADAKAGGNAARARHAEVGARLTTIRGLGVGTACPTCTGTLDQEHFDSVCAFLAREIALNHGLTSDCNAAAARLAAADDDEVEAQIARDEAEAELERLVQIERDAKLAERRMDELQARLVAAQAEVTQVDDKLSRLSVVPFDGARLILVESGIAKLEKLDRALTPDHGLAAQLHATTSRYRDAQQAAVLFEQAVTDAVTVLENTPFDALAHARLEAEATAAQGALTAARVALGRAEEAERGAREQLRRAEGALADYDSRAGRLTELRAEHLTHERAAARMDEFRVAIASTIRPELEELCSGLVSVLTDGRHEAVSLDEDFAMTLYESGVPVEIVSGGTEDVAALAMRIALSQMISQRAGHALELLVLDEVFTALDETRRQNFLALLQRLRKTFRQILLVSHVSETRDQVDHCVELEFDEVAGRTRVIGSTQRQQADEPALAIANR